MICNKDNNFISAILYIHNDQEMIRNTITSIYAIIDAHFSNFEIICVNDASTDLSADIVKSVGTSLKNGSVSIIHLSNYHGVERAMSAGTALAIGDFVFEVDSAVLDYEPDLLMEAYRKCLLGYDIVSASPITAQPRSSKLFYSVFNLFSNTSYPLKTERFRVVSRRAIHRVESLSLTNMYRKALYAASGLQMDCIIYKNAGPPPSGKRDRLLSRWRRSMAIDSLVLFTNFAYRVTLLLSVIMAMFMLISGIYTVAIYVQSRPVEGWAPMMGLISAGFLVLFLVLSVIIKYLDLLLNLIFMKQNYLIANIEKLK